MDEEEEDGIYSIFLKKIRYGSPGGASFESFSSSVSFTDILIYHKKQVDNCDQ